MRKTVKLADREIELAANAASPFIYGKIFKDEDFELGAESFGKWRRMAFVMAKQAEIGTIELYDTSLTEKDFFEWLMQFDTMEFTEIINAAVELFSAQAKPKSHPKEKAE